MTMNWNDVKLILKTVKPDTKVILFKNWYVRLSIKENLLDFLRPFIYQVIYYFSDPLFIIYQVIREKLFAGRTAIAWMQGSFELGSFH